MIIYAVVYVLSRKYKSFFSGNPLMLVEYTIRAYYNEKNQTTFEAICLYDYRRHRFEKPTVHFQYRLGLYID